VLARTHQQTNQQKKEETIMGISGAPVALIVGGAVSNGPAHGVYRVKVTDASVIESKNGRPGLKLELTVDGDTVHKAKNGKKLISAKFYGAAQTDEEEKGKQMNGMLKRGPFKGFGVKWPEAGKELEPRVFVSKTAFVALGAGKNADGSESEYPEVKAIAQEREDLSKFEATSVTTETDGAAAPPPAAKPAATARRARA
jgi:hypothetical protein